MQLEPVFDNNTVRRMNTLFMNSQERHEARYQRRKSKRIEKRRRRNEEIGTLEDIFSYHTLFYAGRKCCNGVRWKQSVQNFERHLFSGTAARRRAVLNGTWKGSGYSHFMLAERGKIRPIDAPKIRDRQVHKVITSHILYPLYEPSMIYDNGASQQGKGLHFSFRRLKEELHRHYRKYGREGHIVLIDLKSFFPSADHSALFRRHDEYILDGRIRNLCDQVIYDFEKHTGTKIGMPLGVEPSQIEMVALPSSADNFARCQLSVDAFAHYMDDYHALFLKLEDAKEFIDIIDVKFRNIGLHINRNKCKIIPLTKSFKYCKATFFITETGAVIVRGNRDSMKRARKKMRSFSKKVKNGEMTMDKVEEWYKVQVSYFGNYNDHNRVLRLNRLYYNILGGAIPCSDSTQSMMKVSA